MDRIARVLSRKRHIEIIRVLRRHRSVSQKTLSRAERQSNLSGKISLRKVKQYTIPEVVVLLDDVFTTGSTLSECALVLKNRGVRKVYAVTIAMEE